MTRGLDIRELDLFPGYGVTEDGRVWRTKKTSNCHREIPMEIKQRYGKDRYLGVVLFREGKRFFVVVHRLVLHAFVGPRPDGLVAAHNDGDKENNHANNLRWCTQKENIEDKTKHGTIVRGERIKRSVLTKADVEWIRAYPVRRGMFREMARRLRVSNCAIYGAYHGKTWRHV